MTEPMEVELLYRSIFTRMSVRKFKPEPLEDEKRLALLKRISKLTPLSPGQAVAFELLGPRQIKGMASAKSPQYLAVYAQNSVQGRINAAFMLQQMDLWFSGQGMGSCWQGMIRPVKEVEKMNGLTYVISLAFGNPDEAALRTGTDQFKRKPLSEITDLSGMESLLEPVRIAPSAINRQPWFITGDGARLRLYCKVPGLLMKGVIESMQQMDMGIGLCHLWLSALEAGKFAGFSQEQRLPGAIAGMEYVWTTSLQ